MSTTATYLATAPWFDDAQVRLQVDFDVLTPELATQINRFWSGADDRLGAEGGDVLRTVIRMFGELAIRHIAADGGASFGQTEDIYWTKKVLKHYEGWPDAQELGILITAAEVSVVDYDDVTLEAI